MNMPSQTRRPQLTRRDFVSTIAGSLLVPRFSLLALPDTPQFPFEDVPPEKSGIRWVHSSGKSAEKYLPESSGAGCAFLDYDNDGWMDIYLVNSGKCDFFNPNPPLRNALYRNNRDGTFTDVTEKAGVAGRRLRTGCCRWRLRWRRFSRSLRHAIRKSILYHNNGDGTFTDVTEKAGVAAPGWSSSAVWFDYDNDGRLDLFVWRFVEFSKSINKPCGSTKTASTTIAFLVSIRRCRAGCFTTMATEHSPMSARDPASPTIRVRPGAWSQPMSTMTGAST